MSRRLLSPSALASLLVEDRATRHALTSAALRVQVGTLKGMAADAHGFPRVYCKRAVASALVFLVRYRLKVLRVDASWVSAQVVNFQTWSDRARKVPIRIAVRVVVHAVQRAPTVSLRQGTVPLPALIVRPSRKREARVEPFVFSHERNITRSGQRINRLAA